MPAMLHDLVVPVDETRSSERCLPVVAAIARRTGAEVELVTIDSPAVNPLEMECYHDRLAREHLQGVLWHGAVDLTTAGVAEELVAHVARRSALLCMSTSARGPVGETVLGSVGDRVVEQSHDVVLLVGPSVRTDAAFVRSSIEGPALALLEGSEADGHVTDAAVRWARALDVQLVLAHVLTAPEADERTRMRGELETLAASVHAAGRTASWVLLEDGDVGRAALHLHGTLGGTIVLGSHQRRPMRRLVLGSNALWITRHAPCPVLLAGRPAPRASLHD